MSSVYEIDYYEAWSHLQDLRWSTKPEFDIKIRNVIMYLEDRLNIESATPIINILLQLGMINLYNDGTVTVVNRYVWQV